MSKKRFSSWFKILVNKVRRRERNKSNTSPSSINLPTPTPFSTTIPLQEIAHRYEGKLLLREEIPLSNEIFKILCNHKHFTATSSFLKTPLFYQCMRCYHKQASPYTTIPCLRCGKEHVYCRRCIEMGRILKCESLYYWSSEPYNWPKYKAPLSWKGTLTSAQAYASARILDSIEKRKSILIWAVTGAGKTEMLYQGMEEALKQGLRICIASPRADVVRELLPRIQAAFDSVHIQGLYSGSRDNDGTAQLIISTTHQLYRYQDAFDVLVIDEIDAFPYHADNSLQLAANRAKRKDASVIYLTATPREKQRWQMMTKQLNYIFVPIRFHGYPLIVPKWINSPSIQKELRATKVPKLVQYWLKSRHTSTRQLLIFMPTVQQLQIMLSPLKKFLLKEKIITVASQVDSVHAEDSNREEKVEAFRKKTITVLLTTTILERGVTFPSIDVIVLHAGHQVFDEAALVQIAGRAGRSPQDPLGEVVFFHDGKTNAMVRSKHSIKEMNQLQKRHPYQ